MNMEISQRLRGHITEDAAVRDLLDEAADDLDGYGELFGKFMLQQEMSMAQFAKLREDQDSLCAMHERYRESVHIHWNVPPETLPQHRFAVLVECDEGIALACYYSGQWSIGKSRVLRWAEFGCSFTTGKKRSIDD